MKHFTFRSTLLFMMFLAPSLLLAATNSPVDHAPDMTHRMMMLAIQLGILLIAARIGGILATKRNIPPVLGELSAGILIGPYLLGAIKLPGFPDGFFPVFSETFAVSPELYGICVFASIILLFCIGLETDARLLLRYSGPGLAIGLGGVIASFFAGTYSATLLLPYMLPGTYTMMSPACLFLGIISSATSVGITARVLSDQRKLDTPEGMSILAGAVIDDVLGIILLAIGMGIMAASQVDGNSIQWSEIGKIAIKAIGIWLGATIVGILIARRISSILKHARDESTIAILALGLALLLAGFFEEARLAMIIGAYVMGLSLSRTDISLVVQDFLHPVQKLLVPVFFAVMGMLVDIRMILNPRILIVTAVFSIIAGLVKIIGCGIPALLFGFNLRGALRIGAGMMPRGEVALIMAGIALSSGFLPHDAFGMVVLTTLLTTISAPPLLTALFKNPASGSRTPEDAVKTTEIVFHFPSADTAELLTGKLRLAFESEGFFVHLVDHSSQLYRLLKDDIAMRLQCTNDSILFTCDENQRSFVSTAMLEVLAEFERTVAELRKPIDTAAILTPTSDSNTSAPQSTQLAAALKPELCIPFLKATTKTQVIHELLDAIMKTGVILDREQAFLDVEKREQMMSTGMQDGVAIPHARTTAVRELTCAIGLKPEGLDFEALDGNPSTIFVLTLSPESGGTPHIQFMAGISNFMADAHNRNALLQQRTPQGMLALLQGKHPGQETPQKHNHIGEWIQKTLSPRKTTTAQTLRKYLQPELVCHNLQSNRPKDVLQELLARIVQQKKLKNPAHILAEIEKREQEISTAMEKGIAVPHLRTDAVSELTCAVGIHHKGIAFGAMDGTPTHIFILTLSPTGKSVPHIQFMASITHRMDPDKRKACLQAKSDRELYDLLVE